MKETQVAKIYAQSIISIAKDNSIDLVKEIEKVSNLFNTSNELEVVMFLDAFKIEDKISIFSSLAEKISLDQVVKNFIEYLITERRINLYNQIYKEIVIADDREKGFLSGVIEGSNEEVDPAFKEKINTYLEKKLGKKINFQYKVNEKVTAGYRVTVDDLLLDASLENQLENFKKTILI